jgi:hypothetical protein
VRQAGFAADVPALGCAGRPYRDVAFAVGPLFPGDQVVVEVLLGRGLAAVDGDDEGVGLEGVGFVDPPLEGKS